MSKGKILVVEDDRDIREGLCELLVRDGYDVAACRSVQEAEKYCLRRCRSVPARCYAPGWKRLRTV